MYNYSLTKLKMKLFIYLILSNNEEQKQYIIISKPQEMTFNHNTKNFEN